MTRPHLGHRLGRRRHRRRRRRRDRARVRRRTAPTPSTCPPGRSRRTSGRRSAGPTRRRSPTGSATRWPASRSRIAVGAISSYDDVNSILLAGRADLCALGRTHLYDPQWTLHAAAEQDYPIAWPKPFAAGSRKPLTGRSDGPKPRLDLVRDPLAEATRHGRWRPTTSEAGETAPLGNRLAECVRRPFR